MATYSKTAREVEMPNGDVVVLHNAVTENSTSNIKKFKYDDNGHVTESTAANATDLNLNSYSTPTTGSTAIGTSDAVQTAIGKLDHQSQIDQTNILYIADNIGKNIIDWSLLQTPARKENVTVTQNNDGSRTFSCTNSAWARVCYEIYIPKGTWVISQKFTNLTTQGNLRFFLTETNSTSAGIIINYAITVGSTGMNQTFVSTGRTYYIWWYVNYNDTAHSNTVTVSELMLCTEEAWNISHAYTPYALPNYDLTWLEAEDRAAIAETVNNGRKNLLDINFISATVNTVVYKNKNDGTIYINGTNSSSSAGIPIADIVSAKTNSMDTRYTLPAGSYVVYLANTAIASKGAISLQVYMHDGTNAVMLTQTSTFAEFRYTTTDKISYPYICVRIHAMGSTSVSQKTVTPMLCSKADFDVSHDSVPYNFTRDELIEIVDSGAKNKLQNIAASKTENGVTWTVGSDGTVTVSTTAGGATDASNLSLTGKYISNTFNNCIIASPTDSSSDCYIYVAYSSNGSSEAVHSEVHSGDILNIRETYPYILIILRIKSGTVLTTPITFKPMICTKAAWDVSQKFVPYRPSWDIIQAAIRRQTFTIEPGTDITIGQQSAYKMNGYVWISLQLKSSTNLSANAAREVCYLPRTAAKQGTSLVVLAGSVEESDINPKAYISSYSNQQPIKIKPTGTIPANTWFYITGTFMTNLPY